MRVNINESNKNGVVRSIKVAEPMKGFNSKITLNSAHFLIQTSIIVSNFFNISESIIMFYTLFVKSASLVTL